MDYQVKQPIPFNRDWKMSPCPVNQNPGKKKVFGAGLVSGAAAGFASDVATGGLSHGFFTIGGAILGALGGTAYAKSQDASDPNGISWVTDFLDRQTRDALLRYLAVTHCGRGRGDYSDPREFPLFWQQETERALEERKEGLHGLLERPSSFYLSTSPAGSQRSISPPSHLMTTDILLKCYPGS